MKSSVVTLITSYKLLEHMKVSSSLWFSYTAGDGSSCSKSSLVLKEKEQQHVHVTKQCSVLFMDKFITGCNFHVDIGNVFSATKPLKQQHRLCSQNAHLNSKGLEYHKLLPQTFH